MNKTTMDRKRRFQFLLDSHSGVPIYRQIIDQVLGAVASGALTKGDQLPTVRQAAVDLTVNPNTVVRAYRELEIRGVLETQQGTGTFITEQGARPDEAERQRYLSQFAGEFLARGRSSGFSVQELLDAIQAACAQLEEKRR